MQADPIKPILKAPGTERLKLQCDEPLSNFAFRFKLRRYNKYVPISWGKKQYGKGKAGPPTLRARSGQGPAQTPYYPRNAPVSLP